MSVLYLKISLLCFPFSFEGCEFLDTCVRAPSFRPEQPAPMPTVWYLVNTHAPLDRDLLAMLGSSLSPA